MSLRNELRPIIRSVLGAIEDPAAQDKELRAKHLELKQRPDWTRWSDFIWEDEIRCQRNDPRRYRVRPERVRSAEDIARRLHGCDKADEQERLF